MKTMILKPALLMLLITSLIAGVGFAKEKKTMPVEAEPQVINKDGKSTAKTESDGLQQPAAPPSIPESRAGEQINWQVISAGGVINGVSANFILSGTVAQTAVGAGSSANFFLSHGFWQEFGSPFECDCIPGDANNDGIINVADAVYVINYVFKEGAPPAPYAICSGDANCDCWCNVADAVYHINYVFKYGPPPCACEEWISSCGPPLAK